MKRPIFLEVPEERGPVAHWHFLRPLLAIAFVAWLFLTKPILFSATAIGAGVLLFIGWQLIGSCLTKRRQAAMAHAQRSALEHVRNEASFEQWMEAVNRECLRLGYTLKSNDSANEAYWRQLWSRKLKAAEAVSVWEEEP
jgi:hypothetical protein